MTPRLFSLFLIGRFFSQFAARLSDFLFPLVIYKQSGSLSLSGFALAVEWLPRVIGLPLCGAVADRLRGGWLFAIADILRATLAVLPFFFLDVLSLLAVSAAFGFLSALSQITQEHVVAASGASLPRTQMSLEAINNLAFILGSAGAGFLVAYMELRTLFLVVAALFICPIPFLRRIGAGDVRPASRFSLVSDVSIAFSILSREPRLRHIVLCGFLLSIVLGIVTSTGPAMVSGIFALPNAAYAQAQMWAAVATILAVLLNRHVPGASDHTRRVGLGILAVGLLLTVVAWSFPIWVLGYGVFFSGIVLFSIYLRCERIAYIPREHFGKALGVIMVLTAAGLPVGGVLVACAAHILPVRGVIALACPVFVAALFWSGISASMATVAPE
jgi:hypothetical protein